MAVKDNYWKSPYYDPSSMQMVYSGQGLGTETPYGVPKNSVAGQLVYSSPGQEDYYGATRHAGRNYNFNPDLSYMFNGSGSRGGAFDRLKNWFSGAKSGTGGKFFAPGAADSLKSFGSTLTNPQFSWNKNSGIQGWGRNLGGALNIGNTLYQGYNVAKGLGELSDTKDVTSDLVSDIITASYSNPMLQYDLTSDQRDMLRNLRRGSYDSESGVDNVDFLGVLGDAVKGGVMGIGGGVPGMLIGAIGGGANAVVDDMNQGQEATNAELEALYQAILESEQQYNALKKQRAYANLAGY